MRVGLEPDFAPRLTERQRRATRGAIMSIKDLNGKDAEAGITCQSACISMVGAGIDFYRLLLIRQGLKLQKVGIKMSSRAPAATTVARRELGIKGDVHKLLAQVEEIIERIQRERGEAS
jgi:hypothetical protein